MSARKVKPLATPKSKAVKPVKAPPVPVEPPPAPVEPPPAPVEPPSDPNKVTIDAAKYGEIRDIRTRMETVAVNFTDVALKIEFLRRQREALSGEYFELDRRFNEFVQAAAKENGIQLEGNNWNLNLQTLTFSRIV